MNDMAHKLCALRFKQGAITFETQEVKFRLDSKGGVSGNMSFTYKAEDKPLKDGGSEITIEKTGVLIGHEIGVLTHGGYQVYFETSHGERRAGTAGQLKALVAIIAKRRAIDAARAKSASKRGPDTLSLHPQSGDDTPELEPRAPDAEPGTDLELAELAAILQKAMSSLAPQERELLNGQVVDGLTQKKLSSRFGLPIGTVGSTIARALKKIRKNLEKSPDLMKVLIQFLR